jgi:ribonuclease-3
VSPRDNERLEYLGDAVLQLITAEYLFKLRPGAAEGEMTQLRSAMVNTNTLAALGEELGLGDYLYLGKGIAKGGGRSLRSLLANAFEAVLGAIFLDAGYDAAYHYYLDRFRALPEPVQDENYKGRVQQVVQERYGLTPYYDSAGARGGRQREYTAVVYAGADPLGTGHGMTKQAAEQEAARNALLELERRTGGRKGRQRQRPAGDERVEMVDMEPTAEVEPGPLEKAVALARAEPDSLGGEEAPVVAEPPAVEPPPAAVAPAPAAEAPASGGETAAPAGEAPGQPAAEARPRRRTRRPRKAEEPRAAETPPEPAGDRELAPSGSGPD